MFFALPQLGCAKGQEIGPTDVVIFQLDPDAGSGMAGAGGNANLPSSEQMTAEPASALPPAAQQPSPLGDAGAADAGRPEEDRPADAGD